MKKFFTLFLGVIFTCLIVFASITQNLWSQPAEGSGRPIPWRNSYIKTDTFASFFPLIYEPNYRLVAFQEYDNPYTIGLNTKNAEEVLIDLTKGRRALYGIKAYNFPFFRVSLEEMTESNYVKNKRAYSDSLTFGAEADSSNEKFETYKDHEYHLVSRKDLSFVGLRGINIFAIANIYFPERKVVITIFFFNTKYDSDELPLVNTEDIIRQLIDYYISYPRT